MIQRIGSVFLGSALLCGASLANDSIGSVQGQEVVLEKTDSIRMKKEVLRITPDQVQVHYTYWNELASERTLGVGFPLPPRCDSPFSGEPSVPSNFKVKLSGQAHAYETRARPVRREQGSAPADLTQVIKQAGLPSSEWPSVDSLSETQKKQLLKDGLLIDFDGEMLWGYCWEITYFWKQKFPPRRDLESYHEYGVGLGSNSSGVLNHEKKWKPFFKVEDRDLNPLGKIGYGDPSNTQNWKAGTAAYLPYILSTGSNWKNGIEDFTLQIDGASLIFVEIDGQLDFDIGSYRFHKKNFKPKGELLVEFVNNGGPSRLEDFTRVEKEINGPANCREGSSKGKVLFSIPDRVRVLVRARDKDWYEVEHSGKRCWTHRQNLRFLPETS